MAVLVVAEHDNQTLHPSTLSVITAALQFKLDIVVLVAGFQCSHVVDQVTQCVGVQRIIHADAQCYRYFFAENLAELIVDMASHFKYILAPATTFGKNVLPRTAALLNVGQVSDVVKILSEDTFVRPIYAGNAFQTVQSLDPIKVMTIRATAFDKVPLQATQSISVEKKDKVIENTKISFVRYEKHQSDRPELTTARIVISGGRGLQNKENFKRLEKIADRLGAAVGASRAAVDAGFVPNDYQVGQTGKVVAPELYIAIGISGAIQHLAGMKDSKVIVAINKDPDAPIFQIADYGLVDDLLKVLPELETELLK